MSKVWFVTGASSGIGAAVAKAALQAGNRVVATARNLEKLRAALGESGNDRLALVQLDVSREAQAEQAVEAALAKSAASTSWSTTPPTASSATSSRSPRSSSSGSSRPTSSA